MKPKVTKHLSNIEIDEISLVDRSANQHAHVAIAKRASEEESMPNLFTEEGAPLSEEELEDGQVVFDEDGQAYQYSLNLDAADEAAEEEEVEVEDSVEETEEVEDDEVGKASMAGMWGGVKNFTSGLKGAAGPVKPGSAMGAGRSTRAFATKNKKAIGATAAAGAGGMGVGYMSKSFSEEVMEELSKAYSDEERDAVLSKALGRVEELLEEQHEAVEIAKAERELRLTNEYISKAADYNLPVDPAELGPVLYRMAETMEYDDCAVIAKCLEAAGAAIFEEVGYIGGGDNVDVLDQVNAVADEYIGKSADVSKAEAWESVFEANPQAYDEYLAQRRGF